AKRDDAAWSIPKGVIHPGGEELDGARREFAEETGGSAAGPATELGRFRQPGGKVVAAYAVEGDFDLAAFRSNSFKMEWPPRSGMIQEFPEADRVGWFAPEMAIRKLLAGQQAVVPALLRLLAG